MRNEKDEIEGSRKGIANIFAKFYNNLYAKENVMKMMKLTKRRHQ